MKRATKLQSLYKELNSWLLYLIIEFYQSTPKMYFHQQTCHHTCKEVLLADASQKFISSILDFIGSLQFVFVCCKQFSVSSYVFGALKIGREYALGKRNKGTNGKDIHTHLHLHT